MKQLNDYIEKNYDKVIGWGTSKYYEDTSRMLDDVEIEYLIDNDMFKQGKKVGGKIIYLPSILNSENPDRVLIVVFSSFYNEICQTINKYGDFYTVSGKQLIRFGNLFKYGNKNILEDDEQNKEVIISISDEYFISSINGVSKFIKEQRNIMNKYNYVNLYMFWEKQNLKGINDVFITIVKNGEELGLFSIENISDEIKNIKAIIIHKLTRINFSILNIVLDLIGHKVPILYYLHDFSCFCSSAKLLYNNKKFCRGYEDGWEKCPSCINEKDRKIIFPYHKKLFNRKNINIISPSESTRDIISKAFEIDKEQITVIKHQKYNLVEKDEIKLNNKIRIAYVGYKDVNKGWEIFKKVAFDFKDKYEFYCLGTSDEIVDGVKYVDVSFIEDGQDAMIKKIIENSIDISLLWSLVPETYSYTYYESYAGGAFIITNENSGNIAEQVKINNNGIVLKNYKELCDLLRNGKALKELIFKNNKTIKNIRPNEEFLYLIENG